MGFCKGMLVAAVAASLLLPVAASAADRRGEPAPRTKIKVHPKRLWHGYGFLPGYRRAGVNGLDRRGAALGARPARDRATGLLRQRPYGWGWPGFYRGRCNGGSFGPCWTSTPIGMMPTCGQ